MIDIKFVINNLNIEQNSKLQKNAISMWWNSVDRLSITLVIILAAFSIIMVTTGSTAVAYRVGLDPLYFAKRQVAYLSLGITCMLVISLCSVNLVRRIAIIGFFIFLALLVAVPFIGYEIKGAKRWIALGSFSLQPSEFAKPFFVVLIAWVLSIKFDDSSFQSFKVALILYIMFAALLILQPDFGMMVSVSVIWIAQLFIAGLSLIWIFTLGLLSIITILTAYIFLPHVKNRIDSFLTPEKFENYQIKKSLEAFKSGGLYGVGPGEGIIKENIPDSHSDFIFSVLGEEMGLITCSLLVIIFLVIVTRSLYITAHERNNFNTLAVSGIAMQFGLQSILNMSMALHLLPTKGVTLPMLSYGGSSIISTSIALGMMLSFTRKRYNIIDLPSRRYRINVQ